MAKHKPPNKTSTRPWLHILIEHTGILRTPWLIVGFGSSLRHINWEVFQRFNTIALNDAGLQYHPTVHFWPDPQLHERYMKCEFPHTLCVSSDQGMRDLERKPNIKFLDHCYVIDRVPEPPVKRADDCLYIANTCSTGAIQLAWKLGATEIHLLGVDGYAPKNGKYYADGNPSEGDRDEKEDKIRNVLIQPRHRQWQVEHKRLAAWWHEQGIGVPVYNHSPLSVIDAWEDPKPPTDTSEELWLRQVTDRIWSPQF